MSIDNTRESILNVADKLFSRFGFYKTSMDEIAKIARKAKGSLYYHFASKEEIFNFLIEEGIKLLQNSVDIKTAKHSNYIDKIKAIVLIQIKIVAKYENIITIILSQFWGTEQRNKKCQNLVYEYIGQIEKIVQEGIEKGEIKISGIEEYLAFRETKPRRVERPDLGGVVQLAIGVDAGDQLRCIRVSQIVVRGNFTGDNRRVSETARDHA